MPQRSFLISGSILSADMANLSQAVSDFEAAGGDWVHVDVMDGRFVPNLTVGIPVVAALKKRTRLPLDVHLMIVEPERYLEDFARAGASVLTVQAEACLHLYRTLQQIRSLGVRAGVALNPATPLSLLEHVLTQMDLVLVMTVEPGFGGQQFLSSMLPKLTTLASWIQQRRLSVDIQVDGGINKDTIGLASSAGANVFVSGTGVFGQGNVTDAVLKLRAALSKTP
jgi:ribulose-phosphate 3-epimerase